MFPIIP